MIKPLALELMRCVLSDLPYYTFRTDSLDYVEILIPKDVLDKKKVIMTLSNHPFISHYMEYILVGEIENEYKEYVLISILKNTTKDFS